MSAVSRLYPDDLSVAASQSVAGSRRPAGRGAGCTEDNMHQPSAREVRRSPARFAASRSALALAGGRAAVVAAQFDVAVGARLPAGSCPADVRQGVRRLLEWAVSLADGGRLSAAELGRFLGGRAAPPEASLGGGADAVQTEGEWHALLSPLGCAALGQLASDGCATEPELAALCRALQAVLASCCREGVAATSAALRADEADCRLLKQWGLEVPAGRSDPVTLGGVVGVLRMRAAMLTAAPVPASPRLGLAGRRWLRLLSAAAGGRKLSPADDCPRPLAVQTRPKQTVAPPANEHLSRCDWPGWLEARYIALLEAVDQHRLEHDSRVAGGGGGDWRPAGLVAVGSHETSMASCYADRYTLEVAAGAASSWAVELLLLPLRSLAGAGTAAAGRPAHQLAAEGLAVLHGDGPVWRLLLPPLVAAGWAAAAVGGRRIRPVLDQAAPGGLYWCRPVGPANGRGKKGSQSAGPSDWHLADMEAAGVTAVRHPPPAGGARGEMRVLDGRAGWLGTSTLAQWPVAGSVQWAVGQLFAAGKPKGAATTLHPDI